MRFDLWQVVRDEKFLLNWPNLDDTLGTSRWSRIDFWVPHLVNEVWNEPSLLLLKGLITIHLFDSTKGITKLRKDLLSLFTQLNLTLSGIEPLEMEPRLAAVHYKHQDLVVYNKTGEKCYQPETKADSALDIHEIRKEEQVDADYVQCDFVEEMLERGDVFMPGFLSQGVA